MSRVVKNGLRRQLELEVPFDNLFIRWFNHKNNHIFKLREFNKLMFLAVDLNN